MIKGALSGERREERGGVAREVTGSKAKVHDFGFS